MKYPHVAARLLNTPLLAHKGKLAAILHGIGARFTGGRSFVIEGALPVEHVAFAGGRPSMGRLGDPLGGALADNNIDPLLVIENVAVIPIEGSLVHKGKWIGAYSGDTSYEGVQTLVTLARARDDVLGVVFEVDSFGGEVSGAYDTAGMIADLSADKPTIAILTDYAYSAGYLLASAARQIIIPESGGAGSIGVVSVHTDYSQAFEQDGLRMTILSAGEHKAEGNPFQPLPQNVADRWTAELERLREQFAQAVADFRPGRISFDEAMATEADSFTGEEAVNRGLADAVMRPSEAFDAFLESVNRAAQPNFPKGSPMTTKTGLAAVRAAVADGSPAIDMIPRAEHDAAVEAARADGARSASAEAEAAGKQAGAAEARARCKAILDSDEAKGREDQARYFAFETDMPAEQAVAALARAPKPAAAPAQGGSVFEAAMRAGGNPVVGPDGGSLGATDEAAEMAANVMTLFRGPAADKRSA
jgi:ClpP class serine protease